MERIRSCNRYQKMLLLCTLTLAVIFSVLYPATLSRVGYAYQDAIFVPREENGGTVYEGKIHGYASSFTVAADQSVTFQYGPKTYGPYTVVQDHTAIPRDNELRAHMDGVEVRCGEEILFRGGVLDLQNYRMLTNADGTAYDTGLVFKGSDGIYRDADGNVVDMMAPTAYTILRLVEGPELTHKGNGIMWFLGMLVCLVTACSILFARELFHVDMAWQVQNADGLEPSDLTIARWHVGWTMLVILTAVVFVRGLA